MNILDDPVPFSSLDDNYMTVDDTNFLQSNETEQECKNAEILFIPNIPIPQIPNKLAILSKHNSKQWLDDLPENIAVQSIELHYEPNQVMNCTCNTVSSKIWEIKCETIQIHVRYYLKVSDTTKLQDCLTMTQSFGEADTFSQSLLNLPRPLPIQRSRRNFVPRLSQVQSNHLEINVHTIEELLMSLSNSWNEEQNVLQTMGFHNSEMNRLVLSRTMGNVNRAVEILVSTQIQDNGMPNGD